MSDSDRDLRIAGLMDEARAELKVRGSLDIASWQARYPDLAGELPVLLQTLCDLDTAVDDWKEPTRDTGAGTVSESSAGAGQTAKELYDFLLPAQQPDEIGRLGPYRVLKVLGHGGMGVVFQAQDPRLGRSVALKAMLPEVAKKPGQKERFLREARAAAAIEHDHIIPIYQVDEDRGVPYIAMPFLQGSSLEDWLKKQAQRTTPASAVSGVSAESGQVRRAEGRQPPGALTVPQILKLGREIAKGLAAAHARGMIHRDIKPANIWLDAGAGGRVKILDFGLARLSDTAGEQHLTQSGAILGTPSYMAPEQAKGQKVDARADLFSLGVVLYRLCSGRLPFQGTNTMSTLLAVTVENPPPPVTLNPELPPGLSDLVMKLLEKDPAKRPASAKAVDEALGRMQAGSAAHPHPPTPSPTEGRGGELSPEGRAEAALSANLTAPGSPLPSTTGPALPSPVLGSPLPSVGEGLGVRARPRRRTPLLVAAALLLLALAPLGYFFGGTVIRFATNKGELIIEVDDKDVEVIVKQDGVVVDDKSTKRQYTLTAGDGAIEVYEKDGIKLATKQFQLTRGGKTTVTVTLKELADARKNAPDPGPALAKASEPTLRYALEFPRAEGSTLTVPSLQLDLRGPRTIEGYITPQSKFGPNEGTSSLIAWNDISIAKGWAFLFAIHGANNLWSFDFQANENGKSVPSAFPMTVGKRTHVALVFTGREFRLFIDGALAVTKDVSDLSFDKRKGQFAMGHRFTGLISEVRVSTVARYDKNFTPAQRFEPDADTLALYHFDEGQGEVLKDSSGNAHHGKIIGAKWVRDDDAWLKQVAALPPAEQVEAVAAKLKERNPGFDGQVTHKISKGVVTELTFVTDNVTDLSPVRALAGLQTLRCFGSPAGKRRLADLSPLRGMKLTTLICSYTQIADLTPLEGMPLTRLECGGTPVADLAPLKGMPLASLSCTGTPVTDLSPLQGMPLTTLDCAGTKVTDLAPLKDMKLTLLYCSKTQVADLSPLRGMPLKDLSCDFKPERDADILRSIKTLEKINGKPAAEFWKAVDGK